MMSEAMIEVKNLKKYFTSQGGLGSSKHHIRAVDDVTMKIEKGTIMGLVGESGSGKTTLAMTMLKLEEATSGSIIIDGIDITRASRSQMVNVRNNTAVVFQDPASNLNPRFTVEKSITRPMIIRGFSKKEARMRAEEVLDRKSVV